MRELKRLYSTAAANILTARLPVCKAAQVLNLAQPFRPTSPHLPLNRVSPTRRCSRARQSTFPIPCKLEIASHFFSNALSFCALSLNPHALRHIFSNDARSASRALLSDSTDRQAVSQKEI